MRVSSPSTGLVLPFGSLMGVVPTDSVEWGRDVRAGWDQRPSEIQRQLHSLIDPPMTRDANAGGKKI